MVDGNKNEVEKDSLSLKNRIASLLLVTLFLLIMFMFISYQNNSYGKYPILFYSLVNFGVVVTGTYIYLVLLELKFELKNINVNSFITLIIIYFMCALSLSFGAYNILNSFFSETVWETYPEYGTYMIPSFGLSMVLIYRILNSFEVSEKENELPDSIEFFSGIKIPIQIKEMKSILNGFIIGTFFISLIAIIFSKSRISMMTVNILESYIFLLVCSTIFVLIELSILFIHAYYPRVSQSDLEVVNEKKNDVLSEYIRKHKKVRYALYIVLIVMFIIVLLNITNPHQMNQQLVNTTVLEINIKEIDSEVTKTCINNSAGVIPLVTINGVEKPLTERMKGLIENNLGNAEYTHRALDISTRKTTYPLKFKVSDEFLSSNKSIDLSNSLDLFPVDYDATIIYSLYKMGYEKCYSLNDFRDSGTIVIAHKAFFNLEDEDNIAIFINVNGGTFAVHTYDITIITANQTMGTEIKNILEYDNERAKINILNTDPVEYKLFNSSMTEN